MGEYRLKIHMETKRLLLTVGFLLSFAVAQVFAATATSTPTVTATPTNVLTWAQFHLNNDNSGFNQHLDDPYLQPKWQASLQPNGAPDKGDVTYSSPAVVLDLGLLGQPDDPAIGIQGTETENVDVQASTVSPANSTGSATIPVDLGANGGVVMGPGGVPAGVTASSGLPGVVSTPMTSQLSIQKIAQGVSDYVTTLSEAW